MIRCTKCQTINPDDAVFCSNCASFLEWTGERIAATDAETPDTAPSDAPAEEPVEAPPTAEAPVEAQVAGETQVAGEAPAEVVAQEPETAPETPAKAPAEVVAQEPDVPVEEPETPVAATSLSEVAPLLEAAPRSKPAPPPEPASPAEAAVVDSEPPLEARRAAAGSTPVAAVPPSTVTPSAAAPTGKPDVEEPPARRPMATPSPEIRRPISGREAPETPEPAEQPAARRPVILPAEPARARPQPALTAPRELEAKPGDLICSVCGTPNDPSRRFCRRCGNSLATAVVAARLPWYRRLFARRRSIVAAGERPRRMGETGQPRRSIVRPLASVLVVIVAAGAAFGYLFVPNLHQRADAFVGDLRLTYLPQIVDLHPPSASGKGVDGHTGALAVDDNTATYWLSDPSAGTPTLTVKLLQPTNLGGLIFHTGSATDSSFTQHRRPKQVSLDFPGTTLAPIELELTDQSQPQSTTLDVRGVTSVEIRVMSWFESGEGGDQLIAVREIEFKERR